MKKTYCDGVRWTPALLDLLNALVGLRWPRFVVMKLVGLDADANHVASVDIHAVCQSRVQQFMG